MLCGGATLLTWFMIRCVSTPARLCDDRNSSTNWYIRRLDYYLWLGGTCKFDSPWLSPYLFVSLCGWVVGIQFQPDSAMLFLHCQDLEMIPQPRSLVSSLSAPGLPELGPSTYNGSALCYAASGMTGLPSVPSLLQPFSATLFYVGPVRLVLITHAFDCRGVTECVTVLQCPS